jgi:proline iminopeptidase
MRILPLILAITTCALTAHAQGARTYSRDDITSRLADLHRIHTPEGIEVVEPVEVNGSTQWISIRGLNKANPVLLVLHGGPGSPLMGMAWSYQKPWEDFFTVVNWDQRGVGKSFTVADSARLGPTFSNEQLLLDGEVIVQHVLKKLGKQKLFLMGYSWGTVFGPHMVTRHPEWYHAWIGMGVSSGGGGEAYLYNRVMHLARASKDTIGIRELEALAPYPGPGPFDIPRALAVRKWVRKYDGGW